MSSASKQARREALALDRYWATQRTNLALCEASPRVSGDVLHAIKTKLLEIHAEHSTHNLGLLNIIHQPSPFEAIGLKDTMSYQEKKDFLEIPKFTRKECERLDKLEHWLRTTSKEKQASWWNFRAGEAARFYSDLNWFPFFVTLTVDPKKINPRRLWQEEKGWQRYITKLARISAKECGVRNVENISNRDYIAYFAQLEHGKSGVHDHVHALIWFRNIPASWKMDPNYHLHEDAATNRRCPPLESVWEWCIPDQRPAIYFWHADCPWQKMGHKTPVDEKTNQGLKLLAPEFTGSYLSKYMSKEDKPWHHQAKATHGIGLERLTHHLKNMTTKELHQLARRKERDLAHLLRTTLTVPEGLMRSLSKREILYRTYRKMSFEKWINSRPKPFQEMQNSVGSGQNPWRMPTKDFYEWLHAVLPPEKIEYSERHLFKALEKLHRTYERKQSKQITTIGAMK